MFLVGPTSRLRRRGRSTASTLGYSSAMPAKRTSTDPTILKGQEVECYLTGESVLRGSASPFPPKSKVPTRIRFTHSNSYGPMDADIFVRVGDPKSPLRFTDFDTVSDWVKAVLVADTMWDDEKEAWVPRPKENVGEMSWQAIYEADIQFTPGKHSIEIKFVSAVELVCSMVLSNWEVNVK
jgi:hypothetical protein